MTFRCHKLSYHPGVVSPAILRAADDVPRTIEDLRQRAGRELSSVPTPDHVTEVALRLLGRAYLRRGPNKGYRRRRTFLITSSGQRVAAAIQTGLTFREAIVLAAIGDVKFSRIRKIGEDLADRQLMTSKSARVCVYQALRRLRGMGLAEYEHGKVRLTALGVAALPDAELYLECLVPTQPEVTP